MASDIKCYGYGGTEWYGYSCKYKKIVDGSSNISEDHYKAHCRSGYESDMESCEWYDKYTNRQYVVTAICKKLFPGMQVPEMEIAKNFRINLEQNPNMFNLLEKYDIVGPILAEIVKNNEQLAHDIYVKIIVPATTLILQGKTNQALKMYIEMVRELISTNKDVVQPYLDIYDVAKTTGEINYDYSKGYQKSFSLKPTPQR